MALFYLTMYTGAIPKNYGGKTSTNQQVVERLGEKKVNVALYKICKYHFYILCSIDKKNTFNDDYKYLDVHHLLPAICSCHFKGLPQTHTGIIQ